MYRPFIYAVLAGAIKLFITFFSLFAMAADIILKSTLSKEIGLQPFIESLGLPSFGMIVTMLSLCDNMALLFSILPLNARNKNIPSNSQKCLKKSEVNPLLPGYFPFFMSFNAVSQFLQR